MTENSEVQILETISTEVDESQVKVIFATQCIKAQAFLVDKLRKQSEHNKETCNIIYSANSKLKFEITQAQRAINSFLISQEMIKTTNVMLKKDLLLAKDEKIEIIEKVKNGEKKYEDMWMESKARYESLPYFRKLLKANEEVDNLIQQITKLEDDKKTLIEEVKIKKNTCLDLDRKQIIKLAEFMVNEMPKGIHFIKERAGAISDLANEMVKLDIKAKANKTEELPLPKTNKVDLKRDPERPTADNINDSDFNMPKLQLRYLDLDFGSLSDKHDQIKIKKADSFKTPERNQTISISFMEINASKVNRKIVNTEEYISSFFNKPSLVFEEYKPKNYSKMKLINILEDIKIDTNETAEIMAKVNTEKLQPVHMISVDDKNTDGTCGFLKRKVNKPIETEDIEELDITGTGSNADSLLLPPTQFLDIAFEAQVSQVFPNEQEKEEASVPASTSKEILNLSQALKGSQEGNKKKVSFDLPSTVERNMVSGAEKPKMADEIDANETLSSQLDVSAVSDEGFTKMKDMLMKKHNLELSPQFVYAKNVMTPLKLQKPDDGVITSKFFQHNQTVSKAESKIVEKVTFNDEQVMEVEDIPASKKENENKSANQSTKNKNPIVEMDTVDNFANVSSPKRQKINEIVYFDKPASGFPFNRDVQMIPDSLDVSIGTTGFEDGDVDLPHYLDASLLLSPKADIPMPITAENQEVLSQDVPNFLSGLRKTGFSFFGHLPSSEPKADASGQNQGGSSFSFNFGGDEKKSRGGLFSMFK